jgi:sugar O-acyltransferase (sialic acid O-acetyltransferase NeuD family)
MMPEKVVVFGSGGHAKVVIDAIEREGLYQVAFLADVDLTRCGNQVLGYPIRSEAEGLGASAEGVAKAIVAIGDNVVRRRIAEAVLHSGLTLVNAIHPEAVVARSAKLGVGTLVMPGSIINADARIGDNVIINSGAIVEHDCDVDDGAHVAPSATLCGGARVGAGTLIGAGATVLPGVCVGAGAQIGAGATVLQDVPEGATAAGSPCRILEKKT